MRPDRLPRAPSPCLNVSSSAAVEPGAAMPFQSSACRSSPAAAVRNVFGLFIIIGCVEVAKRPLRRLGHRRIVVARHGLFIQAGAGPRNVLQNAGMASRDEAGKLGRPCARQISEGRPTVPGSPGSSDRCRSTWNGRPQGRSRSRSGPAPHAKKPFQPANRFASPDQSISFAGRLIRIVRGDHAGDARAMQPAEHRAKCADHQRLARSPRHSSTSIR